MLLVGAVISGCASQTDRSSSGGGAQTATQAEAPAPQAAPAPAYEPERESVQYVDRPLPESPPPKPAVVAVAPKNEPTPDFPVTKYELPEDEEVEDLGTQDDESVSAEQEAAAAGESAVGEATEYADSGQEEEIEDLGTQPDDSGTVQFPEEKRAAADNLVGEPKMYADEPAPTATPAAPQKPAPVAPQKPAPAAPKSVTVDFETEPLFSFDRSEIRGDQRAKLDEFISGLGGTRYDSISVVGHADRIGTKAYNQKLSERRASAVKAYLVKKGIPSDKIHAEGRGESEPVTGDTCKKTRGKALISCLQADRRAEVSVSATKQSN